MDKIIYLDMDEEVTSIVARLKSFPGDEVTFVLPSGALLFGSLINLKVLKKNADLLNKKVTIVTTDRAGKNLAAQVGFEVSTNNKIFAEEQQAETVNSAPSEQVVSLGELIAKREVPFAKRERKKTNWLKSIDFLRKQVKSVSAEDKIPRISPPKGKFVKALGGVIGLATVVILFVMFLVLPSASITIRLQTSSFPYKTQLNVSTLAEVSDEGQKIIIGRLYEQEKTGTVAVKTTGKKNMGEFAHGTINLINRTSKTQSLVAQTQFQSQDGKIFRSDTFVEIPPTRFLPDGSVDPTSVVSVRVTAAERGEAYNIEPGRFTIIKLHPSVWDYIYGESSVAFTGGTDQIISYVTEEDYNSAKQKAVEELAAKARKELTEKIPDDKVSLPSAFSVETLDVKVMQEVGAEVTEIAVKASVKVKVIAYVRADYERVTNLQLSALLSPGTKIVDNQLSKAKREITNFDAAKGQFTIITSGEAIVSRTFDEDKLKRSLIGKTGKEAESYLTSQALVDDVKIKYWPFWVSRIPIQDSRIYFNYEYTSLEAKK